MSTEEVEATRYTLYTVGLRILQLYAPYLPFVTETIYQEIYKKRWGEAPCTKRVLIRCKQMHMEKAPHTNASDS